MKAVISVTGKDKVGIIATVSKECMEFNVNIVDISQSVLQGYFAMIMIADIDNISVDFSVFVDRMAEIGKEKGLEIHTMHESIFDTMHHI